MMETTCDKLLGGRFTVKQPKKGYRIAVDTLLLAAAVPAKEGEKLIEFGCGVGGVLFALARRVTGLSITGLDLQEELIELAEENILLNECESHVQVRVQDIAHMEETDFASFDHVVMNPPFHKAEGHTGSEYKTKHIAHLEGEGCDLSLWLSRAFDVLREGGFCTLIHRADRQEEIIALLKENGFASIRIKPICARPEKAAKRILVLAQKGASKKEASDVSMEAPFILYGLDNRYNEAAEAILREAGPLKI